MGEVPARQTRAAEVRDQIRADIESGAFAPGERLMFPPLCARYQVSVGALREALTGLVGERLVQSIAHHGFTVRPISCADLDDLTEARLLVEPRVLSLSVRAGDVEWESRVMGAFHVLSRSAQGGPASPAGQRAREGFHRALFSACPNRRLLDMVEGLANDARIYRRWSEPEHAGEVAVERQAVLDAVLARDPSLAAKLWSRHIAECGIRTRGAIQNL